MVLYIVRHGATAWNLEKRWQGREDVALSDEGRRQASEAAEALRSVKAQVVLSSTLSRAIETAKIISSELHIPMEKDDRLVEVDLGVASGMYEADIRRQFPDGIYPFMETVECSNERFLAAVRENIIDKGIDSAVIVTHGAAMKRFIATLMDIGEGSKIHYPNGSISVLKWDGHCFTPVRLGVLPCDFAVD